MAPLPKKKHTRGRTGRRRAHTFVAKVGALVPCKNCGKLKYPHRVCANCGSKI